MRHTHQPRHSPLHWRRPGRKVGGRITSWCSPDPRRYLHGPLVRYWLLKDDAEARQRGENLDGTPRRETRPC